MADAMRRVTEVRILHEIVILITLHKGIGNGYRFDRISAYGEGGNGDLKRNIKKRPSDRFFVY